MDVTKIINSLCLSPTTSVPLYLQLANSLASRILESAIPVGAKLPPERELARLLGISRTTAINAYRILEKRGLITTKVGSGTYIKEFSTSNPETEPILWEQLFTAQHQSPLSSLLRTLVATPTAYNTISLAAGMPDPSLYPLNLLESALNGKRHPLDPVDLGYIPTEGYFPFRRSIAAWQQQQGIQASPDNILVVSGSQQGLYLTIKAFIEPRDYVIVESPTYLGAIQILESAGARILCLPNAKNLDLALLEDYLVRYRPKLFYTIPTFQNPTGRVMPLQTRRDIIRLAARHRLVIVEDDPYSQLFYGQQPPPSLKQLDNYGGVIYLGTFSKMLIPGLRTGWVTAAPPVINRLAQEKQYVDLHSNNLSQRILHICLEDNLLSEHLKMVRPEYKQRRDAMINAARRYCSAHLDFSVPEGGFFLWCQLTSQNSASVLLHRAAAAGVSFVPGEAFYPNRSVSNELRLCFATHNEERLVEGMRLLGRVLAASADYAPQTELADRPIL
jgi:DNA-binding transcriptional MocR family regulator